jgi:hypothetical protein
MPPQGGMMPPQGGMMPPQGGMMAQRGISTPDGAGEKYPPYAGYAGAGDPKLGGYPAPGYAAQQQQGYPQAQPGVVELASNPVGPYVAELPGR